MADYRENAIEFYSGDKTATVSFSQGRYINKIKKLAEKYPEECKIVAENDDGTLCAKIPTSWIRIYPGHGRKLTEEEKTASAERLRKYREEMNG